MERHMRGETVAGIRLHEFPEPDVKAIRERTGLSQDQFAHLIGIKAKTLQHWEQRRIRPDGPARALLKIIETNPSVLSVLHHQL
ncbi:transcriptional regulator [Chromatium okenii]|uniref:helix-turn-helix domain-containing protein n=1 Tax=Chromatium okenii TaxID=61644 RepID=UPI001F5B39B4|nr:helix-turn-helix domain-containing protein [Chromatium okenii]MBK1642656.1 transcriptional regulator [Chromatium okenii]